MYKIQSNLFIKEKKESLFRKTKKTCRLKYLSIASLSLFSFTTKAQFTLSGEIRPRAEFRNGFKSLNSSTTNPAFFIEQRSRLNFDYQKEKIGFRISLQDVRIRGNTSQIYKTDPSLTNVFEAWGEYKINNTAAVKIGRQTLSYDNERFLGELDWAQQGRSHDAAKFTYKSNSNFQLHTGIAFNQSFTNEPAKLSGTYYDVSGNYKTMQYLWLNKNGKIGKISFLFLNDGRQKTDSTTAFRQTFGLFANKTITSANLQAEFYYQTGKNLTGQSINAYLASINISFSKIFTSPLFGFDYLSGTHANDTKDKAFDPSFGTNHKFYGHMDYFYVGNAHQQAGRTTGLADLYLHTKFKIKEKSIINVHVHQFFSPVQITDGTQELSSSLAQEADLIYNLNMSENVNLKLGYSHLFSQKALNIIKNTPGTTPNQWAWAMFSINPVLFTNK